MSFEIKPAWSKFVNELNNKSGINLLQVCLEFHRQLSRYFAAEGLTGSSEDIIKILAELEQYSALSADIELLNKLDGMNIAITDYNMDLFREDNEGWELIKDELGYNSGLITQITFLIADKCYPDLNISERDNKRVKEPEGADRADVSAFYQSVLEERRQIKTALQKINIAIEKRMENATNLFLDLWTDHTKATYARSILADELLCRTCFNNYKQLALRLIKQKEPLSITQSLDANFLSFFARQQSFALLQKSKGFIFQTDNNKQYINKCEERINNTQDLAEIKASLKELRDNYTVNVLLQLVNIIKELLNFDARPETVRQIDETEQVIDYLKC